jgi:hypothetical protein
VLGQPNVCGLYQVHCRSLVYGRWWQRYGGTVVTAAALLNKQGRRPGCERQQQQVSCRNGMCLGILPNAFLMVDAWCSC